jgi:aryl-alcohol dehydrogenase-like predicted oxidoreductase
MQNKYSIGTAQFGLPYGISNRSGMLSINEATNIIQYSIDSGINILDTAISYGKSEEVLGSIGINEWHVVSKLPIVPESIVDVTTWVNNSVLESLNRLKIKCLYGLLLHSPLQLLSIQGKKLYESLLELRKNGIVKKIGISIYNPEELDMLIPNFAFDIVQSPYNILDNRLKSSGWVDKLASKDIEIQIRSVFLQGVLLMSMDEQINKFPQWRSLWNKFHTWLKNINMSALQACLAFVKYENKIDRIIVGVDSLRNLKEILAVESSAINLPNHLVCGDLNLINPTKWGIT